MRQVTLADIRRMAKLTRAKLELLAIIRDKAIWYLYNGVEI